MPATGWPRSASLAPSAITTTAGLWRFRSSGRRRNPPAVVSPEMLALTTRHGSPARLIRSASRWTQPWSAERLYAAERLSPNTIIVRAAEAVAAMDNNTTSSNARRKTR